VVDAGYYDTYGVSLAASWLFSKRNQDYFESKRKNRFLLIQIRDTLSEDERALTRVPSGQGAIPGRAVEEVTSPLVALYNSRDGSSSFRNDGQLKLLSQYMRIKGGVADPKRSPFIVANFELGCSAPLSWYLSAEERDLIQRGIDRHEQRLDEVVKWWKDRPALGF
jgi:hypothetical protein